MNIIICGAGRVGFTIAKLLSEQGHSITVIDPSSEDIQKIDDTLDVKSIVGKASYPTILEKANKLITLLAAEQTKKNNLNYSTFYDDELKIKMQKNKLFSGILILVIVLLLLF